VLYQDTWINGSVASVGYRECEKRYAIVRDFCKQYDGPFTVCDIGANQCYFGLRLTEEFPQCAVIAFEYNQYQKRAAHVRRADKTGRLMFVNRKITINDLAILGTLGKFDVVLVLSVLHHFSGSFDAWLSALRGMGKSILAEFAIDDSRASVSADGYRIPDCAIHLGYGQSHLKRNIQRPIVCIPGL
jgi:hypothetical protein